MLIMNIRQASANDEEKWNDYVSRHPQASPYHHFSWRKTIENAYGHQCYYLLAENTDKEIVGVLPTVSITPPFMAGKLCALPFCDLGASLASDKTVEEQLISKAIDIARQYKLHTVEYRSSQNHTINEDVDKSLSKALKVRMLLELPETSEALLAGFKAKLRSQIKKAIKNGLTVETGRSDQMIDEFYDVFSHNMKDLGSPTHSKKWFAEIKNNYNQNMLISIVKYEGLPVAAGIILLNGTMASIPWASTKREFNRLSPNMLLYWSLLEYACNDGYRIFDFGRSTYEEGTYRFKKQWGSKPLPLVWKNFHITNKDNITNDNTMTSKKGNIRPLIESVWKKLPLPLTIIIGSNIRKYISL